MTAINPYTITFLTLGHQHFSAKTARISREPNGRWVTFVEAYTAADALAQFKVGRHSFDYGPGRMSLAHVTCVVESIEPGYPRCTQGHPMESGVGVPGHVLLCPECKTTATFPRSLGDAR